MVQSRRNLSHGGPVLAVLLACAQLVSLVGFPTVRSSSSRSACGGRACGCNTPADSASNDCCCSKTRRSVVLNEFPSCGSIARLADRTDDASCCKKSDTPAVTWVVGLFARQCQGHPATGLLAQEPSVPPAPPVAPKHLEPESDSVREFATASNSIPAIPPDPPPRSVG